MIGPAIGYHEALRIEDGRVYFDTISCIIVFLAGKSLPIFAADDSHIGCPFGSIKNCSGDTLR